MATAAQNPLADEPEEDEVDEPEEDEVELDLVAEDATLRDEVIGKPMRIRLSTGVITVPHIKTWKYEDTRWLDMGQFSMWADAVLSEDDAKIWHAADLENYQVDKIVAFMLSKARATPGKSRGSSNSRSGRRRR